MNVVILKIYEAQPLQDFYSKDVSVNTGCERIELLAWERCFIVLGRNEPAN